MYEIVDPNSATIRTSTAFNPAYEASGLYGYPRVRRIGLHLDTVLPNGTYIEPDIARCNVEGVWRTGVVCPAIRHPGITYVDGAGRPIIYSGNTMLIPRCTGRTV